MPLRVTDTVVCDPVDVRRLDRPAVAPHRREADVIEHDIDHARRSVGRLRRHERRPVRHRLPDVDVDRALERLSHCLLLFPRMAPSAGPQRPAVIWDVRLEDGTTHHLIRVKPRRHAWSYACPGTMDARTVVRPFAAWKPRSSIGD